MIREPRGFNKPIANVRDDMNKGLGKFKPAEMPKQEKTFNQNEMQKRLNALKNLKRGLKWPSVK